MKRLFQILYSLSIVSLLILSSCGGDKLTRESTAGINPLSDGADCAFINDDIPVCGIDENGKITDYANNSVAICYKATSVFQGHCNCSKDIKKLVCMSNKESLTECEAQEAIKKDINLRIEKFNECSASPAL